MRGMWYAQQPFIGSEALTDGRLSRHELRTYYRPIMPNVYLDKRVDPSLRDRTVAAWLWSHREGVLSGAAVDFALRALRSRTLSPWTQSDRVGRRRVNGGRGGAAPTKRSYDSRSTTIAIPCPPPTHMVSTPNVLSCVCRLLSSVAVMRAPVMPNG